MREDNKIVFTGPVGVGKTTAIRALSDGEIVSTDAKASDMTTSRKAQTTVAMDYGVLKLDAHSRVHLYGTPGQERFDFMWDILSTGGLGLVLLLDNTRAHPDRDMSFFVQSFRKYVETVPLVIGVSKMDIKNSPSIRDYNDMVKNTIKNMHIFNSIPPVFSVDGRCREDVKTLVMALLFSLDPGLGT